MSMYKKLIAGFVVATVGLGGVAAFAGEGHGGRREVIRSLVDAADLSPEQRQALRDLREEEREGREALRAERGEVLRDVVDIAEAGADPEALEALLDARIEVHREALHQSLDRALAFWSSLDDQQRADVLAAVRELEAERRGPFRDAD